jgi:CBS domain-containing protein
MQTNTRSARKGGDAQGAQSDAARVTVFRIMSRDVICLKPETTIEALRAILVENAISGAPVVDEAGKPIGIVSTTDVVRDAHERGETEETENVRLPSRGGVSYSPGPGFRSFDPGATVADVMSRRVITILDGTSIARAAELMAKNHVHRLPVVSDTGKVIGLVSSLDILGWLAGLA